MPQTECILSKNDKERAMPVVVTALQQNVGWIDARALQYLIEDTTGMRVSTGRIRGIIHYIRKHGLVKNLIASGRGYRKAKDTVELRRYLDDLQSRAMAIHDIQAALKRQGEEVFGHQLILS